MFCSIINIIKKVINMIKELNENIKDMKEKKYIKTKDISDTYHTIGHLYYRSCVLFSTICNQNKDLAWKSWCHFDNENDPMFEDMFIVGLTTPKGDVTYHFKSEFWNLFDVKELDTAPKWDGHDSDEALVRILSLNKKI